MSEPSWSTIKRTVYERAKGYCEYCKTSEDNSGQTMEVEHIDPDGGDAIANLCLSCGNCNRSKASATAASDPETGELAPLFNPRTQLWSDHFQWADEGHRILGITATGRATVVRFKMNREHMLRARHRWFLAGFHPPIDEELQ
jgi:hypothetical protein